MLLPESLHSNNINTIKELIVCLHLQRKRRNIMGLWVHPRKYAPTLSTAQCLSKTPQAGVQYVHKGL